MLYDKAGNRTRLAYPGASQVIYYTCDAANRISLIKDGSNIINEYLYVGPARVSERKYVKASDDSTRGATQCETNERRPIEWVAVGLLKKCLSERCHAAVVKTRSAPFESGFSRASSIRRPLLLTVVSL